LSGNDSVSLAIHYSKDTDRAVKKGSIKHDMTVGRQSSQVFLWFDLQPQVNNPIKFSPAVPTHPGQLSYRVTFRHPELEPDKLSVVLVANIVPVERLAAVIAVPTLPTIAIMTILFNILTLAPNTVFFSFY
jgi:hypothetical protein